MSSRFSGGFSRSRASLFSHVSLGICEMNADVSSDSDGLLESICIIRTSTQRLNQTKRFLSQRVDFGCIYVSS